MKELRAAEVGAYEEDGALTLAMGDLSADTPWHILLSRTLAPDSRDILLGMTGLWMEVNDRAHSGYDAVEVAAVEPDALTLVVRTARLGLAEDWARIRIVMGEREMASIRGALRRLRELPAESDRAPEG